MDNSTSQLVRLNLDGKEWLLVPGKTNCTASLRRGTYLLVITSDDNKELDRMDINVEDRGPFILNVLGAQTYARGKTEYGNGLTFSQPSKPAPEVALKDKWIKADVDYLFEDPPPSITVSQRAGSEAWKKTYLRRGSPRQHTPGKRTNVGG